MLSPNVCIPFNDTHAHIPVGFTRVTAGDGRQLKGWGAQNPGDTGGATTHTHAFTDTHTMVAHTHTFSTNGGYDNGSGFNDDGGGSQGVGDNHTHSGTTNNPSTGSISQAFTSGSASNLPPSYDVIFIKATNFAALPVNGIVFRATNSRPGLTQHASGNGNFYKGASTGGNAGGTSGSLNHSHSINHSPSAVTHYHGATTNTVNGGVGGGTTSIEHSSQTHNHSFNFATASDTPSAYTGSMGTADNVQPLYKTLCPFINDGAAPVGLLEGDIAFLVGSTIPTGWVACDGDNGTPDMRDYHCKNYDGDSDVDDGTGAGSNSHGHTADNSHSHTAGSAHGHGGTNTGGDSQQGYLDGVGSNHVAPKGHTHTATTNQNQTSSWNANTVTLDTNTDTQPPYLVVKFIMFKFVVSGLALL